MLEKTFTNIHTAHDRSKEINKTTDRAPHASRRYNNHIAQIRSRRVSNGQSATCIPKNHQTLIVSSASSTNSKQHTPAIAHLSGACEMSAVLLSGSLNIARHGSSLPLTLRQTFMPAVRQR